MYSIKAKFLTLVVIVFVTLTSNAQVIWSESFSAGSAARGTSAVAYPGSSGGNWTQTTNILGGGEGASANQWYVSGEECGNAASVCGSACPNADASLHISAIGGLCGTPDCGAAYDETSAANRTDKRIESPTINTTGYGGLTLSFNYIAAQGDDGVSVVYSCNGGTTWNALPILGATSCCDCNDAFLCGFLGLCCGGITVCSGLGQGYWTTQNYALPVCAENNPNLRIGFHWVNDGDGIGTDPSIAIDDITITSSVPLAATLVKFIGINQQNEINLQWSTASEFENDFFIIERRSISGIFETIGRVDGAGNSSEFLNYSFVDQKPFEGDNYYRLTMVDANGVKTYSDVIYIPFFDKFKLSSFYPNPASDFINCIIQSATDQNLSILICDNQGRILSQSNQFLEKGVNTLKTDVSALNAGNYMCILESEGKRIHKPFIIY